jgi:hypothetical protein
MSLGGCDLCTRWGGNSIFSKMYLSQSNLSILHESITTINVCLFLAAWAIFRLSGVCHHYWKHGCKFRPVLGIHGFKQLGFFFVPYLLRHGTSVYTVSSEGPAPKSYSRIRTGDARTTRSLFVYGIVFSLTILISFINSSSHPIWSNINWWYFVSRQRKIYVCFRWPYRP